MDIQGNFGLPLSNVTLDAGRLHFELESPLGLAVWDGEVGDEAMPAQSREAIPDEEAMVDSIVAEELAAWRSPWFGSFLGHDPRPAIVALDVPVLALFGELDTQVPAPANSIAMSEAIGESSVPSYTIATILSANHLFQEAVTGSVNEYARLKREFAPDFVEILTEWFRDYFRER